MAANVNSIIQLPIQIKNWIMKHANVSLKIIAHNKKDYSWNLRACICENDKSLKRIADDSKNVCDQIVFVMNCINKWGKCYEQMLRILC